MPYSQATVSVTSATVPVSLIAPGNKTAWMLHLRQAAAVPILVFFYTGTLPGAAPANVYELTAGANLTDDEELDSYRNDSFGAGIAAVLESGTVAATVDVIWRS